MRARGLQDFLGFQTPCRPGDSLEPFKTRLGTIGVMICYDGCFVEVPRVLTLKGADFLLWPSRSGEYLAGQSLPHVRCLDNVITIVQIEGGQTGQHLPVEGWSTVYSQDGSRILSQRKDSTPFRVTIDIEAGRHQFILSRSLSTRYG